MAEQRQSWELYERLIARMISDQVETDLCVTPNARIIGKISGRSRQIDVLIDSRYDTDNRRRIIVDAKNRSRKIDVTDVEAFRGLMEDVGATHGYLISPSGHTKAAEMRAQMAVTIRLVALDRLENFDPSTWPHCKNIHCKAGRVFWDGYPEFTLVLQPNDSAIKGEKVQVPFVHYVGKCDRCGRFHIRCLTCDDLLAIPEDDEGDYGHQCNCKLPLFWLASIEEDEIGERSAELHVILGASQIITVDRRPVR